MHARRQGQRRRDPRHRRHRHRCSTSGARAQRTVYELFGGPVRDSMRLLVPLHDLPGRPGGRCSRPSAPSPTSSPWAAGGRQGVHRAQDECPHLRDHPPRPTSRLRPRQGLPRAQPEALRDQCRVRAAGDLRRGAGEQMDIIVDLNFNSRTKRFLRIARQWSPTTSPGGDRHAGPPGRFALTSRSRTTIPVASCECPLRPRLPPSRSSRSSSPSSTRRRTASASRCRSPPMADTFEVDVARPPVSRHLHHDDDHTSGKWCDLALVDRPDHVHR